MSRRLAMRRKFGGQNYGQNTVSRQSFAPKTVRAKNCTENRGPSRRCRLFTWCCSVVL
jgi:hypothetical protein